ncbi:MAG: hypothetical protein WCN88_02290 [Candidatus Falkowbacteria bacterium]
MTDKNKNNTGKTEIQWRDRLLLESLIAQILPGLIISDHDKANKIIEMIKEEELTIKNFLKLYPEYKGIEITNSEAIEKRFNQKSENKNQDFFPIVNFNHKILYYLTDLIKERDILDVQNDNDFSFQLRVSLYNNFNRYLNLLLTKLAPEDLESLYQVLINISDKDELLGVLSNRLKQAPNLIINNFLNLGLK